MGRRKIDILHLSDARNRSVTFQKRKAGLFKKALELSLLCGCDVALIVIAEPELGGTLHEYCSSDPQAIWQQFVQRSQEDHECLINGDYYTAGYNQSEKKVRSGPIRSRKWVVPAMSIPPSAAVSMPSSASAPSSSSSSNLHVYTQQQLVSHLSTGAGSALHALNPPVQSPSTAAAPLFPSAADNSSSQSFPQPSALAASNFRTIGASSSAPAPSSSSLSSSGPGLPSSDILMTGPSLSLPSMAYPQLPQGGPAVLKDPHGPDGRRSPSSASSDSSEDPNEDDEADLASGSSEGQGSSAARRPPASRKGKNAAAQLLQKPPKQGAQLGSRNSRIPSNFDGTTGLDPRSSTATAASVAVPAVARGGSNREAAATGGRKRTRDDAAVSAMAGSGSPLDFPPHPSFVLPPAATPSMTLPSSYGDFVGLVGSASGLSPKDPRYSLQQQQQQQQQQQRPMGMGQLPSAGGSGSGSVLYGGEGPAASSSNALPMKRRRDLSLDMPSVAGRGLSPTIASPGLAFSRPPGSSSLVVDSGVMGAGVGSGIGVTAVGDSDGMGRRAAEGGSDARLRSQTALGQEQQQPHLPLVPPAKGLLSAIPPNSLSTSMLSASTGGSGLLMSSGGIGFVGSAGPGMSFGPTPSETAPFGMSSIVGGGAPGAPILLGSHPLPVGLQPTPAGQQPGGLPSMLTPSGLFSHSPSAGNNSMDWWK